MMSYHLLCFTKTSENVSGLDLCTSSVYRGAMKLPHSTFIRENTLFSVAFLSDFYQ